MNLLRIFSFLLPVVVTNGQSYTMTVLEGEPVNTRVGSIQSDPQFARSFASVNRTNLRYMFFGERNPWQSSFRMEDASGIIYTATALDRESVCPDFIVECYQDFDVAVHSEDVFKILKLKIEIGDINDNAPEFPEPEVTVSIPESANIGFIVPVTGATDKDTGTSNGVQSYEIIPSDGQFTVSIIENLDGTPEVGLVVDRKLDREAMSSHTVQILAKDGGVPSRTGTVTVTIVVTDANDHSPAFKQTVYNITVNENLPVNTIITQVQATDKDTGANGQISYRFSSRTAEKFSHVFAINMTSGEIRVMGVVDYEISHQYRLVVEAVDRGAQPQTAQAVVLVNLIDMNDNAPTLKYNFLPRGEHAVVSEKENLNHFVAHVSAMDEDSGENAVVDCVINNPEFKVSRLYDNEFQIDLGVQLDREAISEYNVTVLCDDRGRPSLTVGGYFLVVVKDENDNSPEFKLESYLVSVKESTAIGQGILQVSASDKDAGNNGEVTYEVRGENSTYFSIDRYSGMISIRGKLDYEASPEISFHVIASDGGVPPRQSNVTVVVMVLDVNDEHPEFTDSQFYRFRLTENSAKDTVVGRVSATDRDPGLGGQVRYSLRDSPESTGLFTVSAVDGVIKSTRPIDRENPKISPLINFFVVATDKGDNPLTSTARVTVEIDDINDNSPMVQLAYMANRSVTVYNNHSPQKPFVKVIAEDPDKGENGTLSFSIEAGDPKSLFYMDSKSGEIYLRMNTSSKGVVKSQETVSVLVAVRDNGTPQRVTLKRFNITVLPTNTSNAVPQKSEGLPNNFIIVIAVICATTFLSVIIIVIIFIIRRQNQREDAAAERDAKDKMSDKKQNNVSSENNCPHDPISNNANGKTKKGVNFVFQNEHGILSQESSTDPVSMMAAHHQRPSHDVIRQPKPLGAQNSLNLIWLDAKHEPARPGPESLPSNIVSPNSIPASAKLWLHGTRGDDETSNVSGETVTSDSGRGGSEEDAHSRRLCPMEEQDSLTKDLGVTGLEGEYVDMQRSPLSYLAAFRNYDGLNTKLPDHYYNILKQKPGCEEVKNGMYPHMEGGNDHHGYTKMSPVISEHRSVSPPPPIPRRQRRSSRTTSERLNPKCSVFSEPVVKIDVGQICRSHRRPTLSRSSESLEARTDMTVTTYDGDSSTTTSGSYTIDDLSEFESHAPQTANV